MSGGTVDECWAKVNGYFQIFQEWYSDIELYHYIGYLIAGGYYSLDCLVNKYKSEKNKRDFLNWLKNEIYGKVSVPALDHQYKDDGSDKGKCRHILLFHNIQTVINQNSKLKGNAKYGEGVFYKFPFNLYKKESWDVEHINSNTTNPENDEGTQKEWLINVYAGVDKGVQKKIEEYFNNDKPNNDLFTEIHKLVDTGEEWSPEEKNRIWNYALLDSSTNRSYGNAIFSAKRRIIVGKDRGRYIAVPKLTKDGKLEAGEERDADSSFVPICTKQVFLKYYSPKLGSFNYWDKEDAAAYMKDIENCINKLRKQDDEQ